MAAKAATAAAVATMMYERVSVFPPELREGCTGCQWLHCRSMHWQTPAKRRSAIARPGLLSTSARVRPECGLVCCRLATPQLWRHCTTGHFWSRFARCITAKRFDLYGESRRRALRPRSGSVVTLWTQADRSDVWSTALLCYSQSISLSAYQPSHLITICCYRYCYCYHK